MKLAIWAAIVSGCCIAGCSGDAERGVEEEILGDAELSVNAGEPIFKGETFGGNGRTCRTCHSDATGTFSPREARALFATDPEAPLFRAIDSDDGTGASYERLLTHATVLVTIPLPRNVRLVGDTAATSVTVERGSPTTLNAPNLDPVLMADGREPDLKAQALSAVHAHMQPTIEPTADQLEKIAGFERKQFSSKAIERLAWLNREPGLPEGTTESEQRGRRFFLPLPNNPLNLEGFCAHCHDGPLLNTVNRFNQGGLPVGARFVNVLVSDRNLRRLPLQVFEFTNPDGSTSVEESPDPGRALVTGDRRDLNAFKIPSLRNIKNTAPYFHDSSSKTLEDVAAHYDFFVSQFSPLRFSEQDQADIVAFLKLL